MNTEEVKTALNDVFNSAEVKTIGSANQLKISTKYKVMKFCGSRSRSSAKTI